MSLLIRKFRTDIHSLEIPEKFTFPFFYEPHPLCQVAATELQEHLKTDPALYNLLDPQAPNSLPYGKMFGVLVVQDPAGELGYLCGFSGKLGSLDTPEGFVPPVFDLWNRDGFFIKEEQVLNALNQEISDLENHPEYGTLQNLLRITQQDSECALVDYKEELKKRKKERKILREQTKLTPNTAAFRDFEEDLVKQSLRDKHELRVLQAQLGMEIERLKKELETFEIPLCQLKESRKEKSNLLQTKLFEHYQFLNRDGLKKNLLEIFELTSFPKPPAAAGDCAAPKLLQYAFLHHLTPIAMAEFWWGKDAKSEIRKHQHYYPACRGKCEPILGHMLSGMQLDENPLLISHSEDLKLHIVYEDDDILLVDKPAELLSVPGIAIQDSVYTRIQARYPHLKGPIIVHRLDMATSGLLLLAKNKESHENLQRQFLKKTIQKRYVALLEGKLQEPKGSISLPLRVDLEDRPRQLVCFEHGKQADTNWELISVQHGRSKVYFYPITGRTHQLRMHASHPLGLNAPIVGDDLYGTKSNRLHLHAESLHFQHPKSKEWLHFSVAENF